MSSWSPKLEEDLVNLLKDWLKQRGRTQADLRISLQAASTRMPAILDVLKKEYREGGMHKLVAKLCSIEEQWSTNLPKTTDNKSSEDRFGQLDLLLQEIRDDCDRSSEDQASKKSIDSK